MLQAAHWGFPEVVGWGLEQGCSPFAKDNDGQTPRQLALDEARRYTQAASLLKAAEKEQKSKKKPSTL